MNNVDAVNCGHIGAGDQLPEQKPTVTTTSWSTTHFESINTKLQLTESSDLENKDKIIMGVAVISSLLVLILVYSAVIRPYWKRKTVEPIDTSRAPMDLTFRPPVRKQNRLKACCFCTP